MPDVRETTRSSLKNIEFCSCLLGGHHRACFCCLAGRASSFDSWQLADESSRSTDLSTAPNGSGKDMRPPAVMMSLHSS
jgi:hypothetical protein